MFCPNCGNSVSDHQKFCARCGTRLPDRAAAAARYQMRNQTKPAVRETAPEADPFGTLSQEKVISGITPAFRPAKTCEPADRFHPKTRQDVKEPPVIPQQLGYEEMTDQPSFAPDSVWEEYRIEQTQVLPASGMDLQPPANEPQVRFPKNVSVEEYKQFMYGDRQKFRESHPDKFI